MTKISMNTKLGVSADDLWRTIGGFNALADWHPAIEKSEMEDGGKVRRLSLAGGGTLVETLEEHDDNSRTYTYRIDESPLPIANYHATISVSDADGGSSVDWSAEFDADGAPEADAKDIIQGIFQAGFDNLKKMYGG